MFLSVLEIIMFSNMLKLTFSKISCKSNDFVSNNQEKSRKTLSAR